MSLPTKYGGIEYADWGIGHTDIDPRYGLRTRVLTNSFSLVEYANIPFPRYLIGCDPINPMPKSKRFPVNIQEDVLIMGSTNRALTSRRRR